MIEYNLKNCSEVSIKIILHLDNSVTSLNALFYATFSSIFHITVLVQQRYIVASIPWKYLIIIYKQILFSKLRKETEAKRSVSIYFIGLAFLVTPY